MLDAQWEYLFERVLVKLEEIRCGLIDIEMLLEKVNGNAQLIGYLKEEAIKTQSKACAELVASVMTNVHKGAESNG